MTTLMTMSDATLKLMQIRTDSLIAEQGRLMASTPEDTRAYRAMAESRPGLIGYRNAVDAELDRRGF